MFIAEHTIATVLQHCDIVEIIRIHLKLKKSGTSYFALCPFHDDKTPSFSVSASKQLYHCFGCGESGNVLNFLTKYLGLDFVTAVEQLAAHCGIPLESAVSDNAYLDKEQKQQIYQLLARITKYYQLTLQQCTIAQQYLAKRGINHQTIVTFALGYAPAVNSLSSTFPNDREHLMSTGLYAQLDNNVYDKFRARVMFPIKDIQGKVIAFGGRLHTAGEPKYLNSTESIVFHKSEVLYGLYEAKQHISKHNAVIVVEGYFDVISLHQYGIKNTVATMGTAISAEHNRILFKLADCIYYCFDSDQAGQKAAWRAVEHVIDQINDAKMVFFMQLPVGHDPDSLVRLHNKQGINNSMQAAIGLIAFLVQYLRNEVNLNLQHHEGKAKLISLIKPYYRRLTSKSLAVLLQQQLATIVAIDTHIMAALLLDHALPIVLTPQNKYKNPKPIYKPPQANNLANIVRALLHEPKLSRVYPVPELDSLATINVDITELCKLIAYLETHCDDFDDIDSNAIRTLVNFSSISLQDIYYQVKNDHASYQLNFSMDPASYCAALEHLFTHKTYCRLPHMIKQVDTNL